MLNVEECAPNCEVAYENRSLASQLKNSGFMPTEIFFLLKYGIIFNTNSNVGDGEIRMN